MALYSEGPVMQAHTAGFVVGADRYRSLSDNGAVLSEERDRYQEHAAALVPEAILDAPTEERQAWEAGFEEGALYICDIQEAADNPADFGLNDEDLDSLTFSIGTTDGTHYDECAHWDRPEGATPRCTWGGLSPEALTRIRAAS